MLALIGILVVFGAVLGGFLLERGNPYVLMQPAELLIICGSAGGIVLVSNSPASIRKMLAGIVSAFNPPPLGPQVFLRNLRMLYEIFIYSKRARGIMQIETDIEQPEKSPIFSNHPEFLCDRVTRDFVCDSLRMLVIGATTPHEL